MGVGWEECAVLWAQCNEYRVAHFSVTLTLLKISASYKARIIEQVSENARFLSITANKHRKQRYLADFIL